MAFFLMQPTACFLKYCMCVLQYEVAYKNFYITQEFKY